MSRTSWLSVRVDIESIHLFMLNFSLPSFTSIPPSSARIYHFCGCSSAPTFVFRLTGRNVNNRFSQKATFRQLLLCSLELSPRSSDSARYKWYVQLDTFEHDFYWISLFCEMFHVSWRKIKRLRTYLYLFSVFISCRILTVAFLFSCSILIGESSASAVTSACSPSLGLYGNLVPFVLSFFLLIQTWHAISRQIVKWML